MILGRSAIIQALLDGDIRHSNMPSPERDKKKFDEWCARFIEPASMDFTIGYDFYEPINEYHKNSQVMFTSAPRSVTLRPHSDNTFPLAHQYFKLFEIKDKTTVYTLPPRSRVLVCSEFEIGVSGKLAAQVATRSTAKRWGLDVCGSAGWVDPGFFSRITLEIYNENDFCVELKPGMCYSQLVFMRMELSKDDKGYEGYYNLNAEEWKPSMMLPKVLKDK